MAQARRFLYPHFTRVAHQQIGPTIFKPKRKKERTNESKKVGLTGKIDIVGVHFAYFTFSTRCRAAVLAVRFVAWVWVSECAGSIHSLGDQQGFFIRRLMGTQKQVRVVTYSVPKCTTKSELCPPNIPLIVNCI